MQRTFESQLRGIKKMVINLCHKQENKINTTSHEIMSFNFVMTMQHWYLKPNIEQLNKEK